MQKDMGVSKRESTKGKRGTYGFNPPKSKKAKDNWERCNTKGSKAGKATKVIDMRKVKSK